MAAPRAEADVIQDFYREMTEKAQERRLHRERSGSIRGGARQQREELYLDPAQLTASEAASAAYLRRHPEWLQRGSQRCSAAALRRRVAMQHFIELDLEAPTAEDAFCPEHRVCRQMLLDAARGTYVVAGERLDFATDLQASGVSLEEEPMCVERMKEACASRLAAAVRRCLGGGAERGPSEALLRVVTSHMSQAGLANVERACGGGSVAVGGGEQDVRFELKACGLDAWELALSVEKHGFGYCMLCDCEDHPDPIECSPRSRVARGATIRFAAVGDGGVEAEALHVHAQLRLVDAQGRAMQLPPPWQPEDDRPPSLLGRLPVPVVCRDGGAQLCSLARAGARAALGATSGCMAGCFAGCGQALSRAARAAAWPRGALARIGALAALLGQAMLGKERNLEEDPRSPLGSAS